MKREELLRLARAGAEARIADLRTEIDRIRRYFGRDLRTSIDVGGPPIRKRRRMSAATRRRMSDAQKTRWAKRKAKAVPKKK